MQAIAAVRSLGAELFGELAVEAVALSGSWRALAQAGLFAQNLFWFTLPAPVCRGERCRVLWCLAQEGNRTRGYNVWRAASAVARVKATPGPRLGHARARQSGTDSSGMGPTASLTRCACGISSPVTAEMAIA